MGSALLGHHDVVERVVWSEDGKQLASGSKDGKVLVWNVETEGYMFVMEKTAEELDDEAPDESVVYRSVTCLAWSADGKRLESGSNMTVRLWNAETGKAV